jgi:predicted CopG family antitoxin
VTLLSVYVLCMGFKTLTISDEAHQRLSKRKLPGESFTQVILRELPEPLTTAGDVLDFLASERPPKIDRKALALLRKNRARRSNANGFVIQTNS